MQPRVLAPLNDRLLYINEDGSRREDLIARAIEDRITVDKLRYAHLSEHWTEEDWYRDAKSVIEARVHGEEQQYWGNVETRALGGTTVSDDLAAKVAVLAQQAALASVDFWEALSDVHCDNLEIVGETSCENPDDFADWARRAAHDRTYAPFEGVRGVSKFRPVVELAPFFQQAAE